MSGGDVPNRPAYLGSDRLDDLARMLTEVTSELWILKDRNMVLEALLAEAGVVTPASVEGYQPDDETAQRIAAERSAFTARIFGAVLPNDQRLGRELGTVER
ncbi:hypothetical protein [Nocardioides jishulii]|uniref:Uncharacterized protein n=1 Tax=Nocardioides jishulii TaxID=2575440 RepID=A0A4U2YJV6_9ACTN|nr:hypothetical protein [Nocardioides jishulii]QCX28008.1 hypothetical protein FCL41_11125 [Nocardioides jishulii]TKI60672.1 hypothetical protein FC770_14200 [Nocardioides jishulii]